MKKSVYAALALLVTAFLTMPGWARQGNAHHGTGKASTHHHTSSSKSPHAGARSNQGGKVRGLERAEEVQAMNKRADANRGFTVAPGVEKAESLQAGKTAAKTGKKSQTRKGNDKDEDRD